MRALIIALFLICLPRQVWIHTEHQFSSGNIALSRINMGPPFRNRFIQFKNKPCCVWFAESAHDIFDAARDDRIWIFYGRELASPNYYIFFAHYCERFNGDILIREENEAFAANLGGNNPVAAFEIANRYYPLRIISDWNPRNQDSINSYVLRYSAADVNQLRGILDTCAVIGNCKSPRWSSCDIGVQRYPGPLLGLHLVQLSLHRVLLPQQENGSRSGYNNASYIESKTLSLPRSATVILGTAIIGICVMGVIYCLKRDSYMLLIGLFLMFIPFFFGLSLVVYNRCPPYLVGLYSTLPICRYEVPYHDL